MNFVKTEQYSELEKFVKNDMFFNIFMFGPKGCGKTKTIEHLHKENNKKLYRVNITIETDEDSLMGGFRLRDGQTYFDKGPVLKAMEDGATLLLDECDQGHPQRLMCLQSVLEGSPYLIKRTSELVEPKEGFKVWATANTKGGGDETGHYIGAQILNGAMKDRFSAFIEFNYPSEEVELNILKSIKEGIETKYNDKTIEEKQLVSLVKWANKVRSSFDGSNHEELISSRKLIDIVKCFYFVDDLEKAMRMCMGGYDIDQINAFMKIYELLESPDVTTIKKQYMKF